MYIYQSTKVLYYMKIELQKGPGITSTSLTLNN